MSHILRVAEGLCSARRSSCRIPQASGASAIVQDVGHSVLGGHSKTHTKSRGCCLVSVDMDGGASAASAFNCLVPFLISQPVFLSCLLCCLVARSTFLPRSSHLPGLASPCPFIVISNAPKGLNFFSLCLLLPRMPSPGNNAGVSPFIHF